MRCQRLLLLRPFALFALSRFDLKHEKHLRLLRLQHRHRPSLRRGRAAHGRGDRAPRPHPRLRRRAHRPDGRDRAFGARERRPCRGRDSGSAAAQGARLRRSDRAARRAHDARTQADDGRPRRRLRRHAGRLRHVRGVLRSADLVAARHSPQALRAPQRQRVLRRDARALRPCRRGGFRAPAPSLDGARRGRARRPAQCNGALRAAGRREVARRLPHL